MATIRINNQDVEVTEEFKQFYEQIEREEASADRGYRRYNQSLEASFEGGHDFEYVQIDDDEDKSKECEALHQAIEQLNERDRQIIQAIFFDNKPKAEVAKNLGWSGGNLTHHLRSIYKKLEKLMEKILKSSDFSVL